jgi:integrase
MELYLKDHTIYLRAYRNGQRIKISTGIKIDRKRWNARKQHLNIYTPADRRAQDSINAFVQRYERLTNEMPELQNDDLKFILKNGEPRNEVRSVWKSMITNMELTGKPALARRYESQMRKVYDINPQIKWTDFDLSFYDHFLQWHTQRNYKVNTIGRAVVYLKTMLKWAADRGYHQNFAFKNYKPISEQLAVEYVTSSELEQLYRFEHYSEDQRRTVDHFVFMCHTGLRYSDAVNVGPRHFKNGCIVIQVQKTGEADLVIPLSNVAQNIAEKYNYRLKMSSSQKMNDTLRRAAHGAGLFREMSNGQQLCQRISTKYARKTFVTLSLEKGMSADVIMSITGHKKYEVLRKYMKITDKFKIKEIEKWND